MNKNSKDFYAPGEALSYRNPIFTPIPEEQLTLGKLLPEWVSAEWSAPKGVNGDIGDGKEISPYRPWRRKAKEVIFERLKMIPEQMQFQTGRRLPEEIPQPPTIFLDGVPNFSEVPLFAGNTSFGQVETERGDWGQLISSLTQTAVGILESEKKRYQAQIQAQQAALKPPEVPKTESKFLTYLLIGGGIFLALRYMKKGGKGGKKI
jgi:hypothetical protein